MKFQLLVTLFAATATAYSPPVCKPQPAHCQYADAAQCRKLISQGHFEVATCQAPAKIATSTRTVTPTRYVTKTVQPCASTKKAYVTTTKKGKPTKRPTKTVTAYTTKVTTKTQVYKSTKTLAPYISTITKFAPTSTATATSTSTVTSVVEVEYTRPECKLVPNPAPDPGRKRSNRYNSPSLPKQCADCFLTTTKGAKPAKTVTATKTLHAVTHTVYKKSHKTPTVTRKVTVTRYAAGPTQPAPEYTKTITDKKTQTSHVRSVVTTKSTSFTTARVTPTTTTTKTTSTLKIVEQTAEPCQDIEDIYGHAFSGPVNMVLQPLASTLTECCRKCYGTTDCVFFKFSPNGRCDIAVTFETLGLRCEGDQCPRGFVGLGGASNPDGAAFYPGKCSGPIQN